ncbi:MAG: caspase family protein, partial [Bradyrhizobium sp.]|nr:caspase family protein [Bradyrhizobium sp.]
AQPINDARALTGALRRGGFDVDVVEDASKDDLARAVERLTARIKPDSVVMLFFGGYAIQAGRDSYMIPTDAKIWKEADVRREGTSIERVLDAVSEKGARAKLVVIDASRRNPFERRFRAYSHGLAPINAPANALIMSSATPGKVLDDPQQANSVLVSELLNQLGKSPSAETVFNKTRNAIARSSDGEQVPTVSSSLVEDIRLSADVANAGS